MKENMYLPFIKTHFSLLRALNKPESVSSKLDSLNCGSAVLCDFGLSGAIEWFKSCQESKRKPILGTTIQILQDNGLYNLKLIAKNYKGWKELIKIVSAANNEPNFVKKPKNQPRIDGYASLTLEQLGDLERENIIGVCGGFDSLLYPELFSDNKALLSESPRNFIRTDCVDCLENKVLQLKELFPTFYLGVDRNDSPLSKLFYDSTKYLGNKLGIKVAATPTSLYLNKGDDYDHKVLLYNLVGTTVNSMNRRMEQEENSILAPHFQTGNEYLKTLEEVSSLYSEDEIKNALEIDSQCEAYNILSSPILPKFDCPNGQSPIDYLKHLCREGWKNKVIGKIPEQSWGEYGDRVNYEFSVIEKANLPSYFLSVWDIVQFIKKKQWLSPIGRGSGAGSIVCWLLNITQPNPIKYGLLFDRFYNEGRNKPGHIKMPDIDLDVPVEKKEEIQDYIRNKYGHDKVGQLATFQTIKGRGALKHVFKVYGNVSFEEVNNITENIDSEASIMDELQEMKEESEDGSSSIIRWALENKPEQFKNWCEIKDGKFEGPLATYFEQSIRLESTKISRGKHPSGIVISIDSLNETCPLIYDSETKTNIVGYDLNSCESIGLIKHDILGVAIYDKLMKIKELLRQ